MSGSSAYTKLLVLLSTVVVATAAGISTFGHRGEIGTFEVPTAQAQPRRNGEPSAEAGKTIFAQERLEQYRLQPSSAALQSVGSQLTPHRVHALIEGIDAVPRELDDTALESLNDLWATHVLRQRRFPKDIVAILEALKPLEQ